MIRLTLNSSRFDAISKAREWVATLDKPLTAITLPYEPVAARYSMNDILSLVNPDIRKPFDMSEVVLRLIDDSRISAYKPKFGRNLITAFAQIHGL